MASSKDSSLLPKRLTDLISILTKAEQKNLVYWLTAEFDGKKETARNLYNAIIENIPETEIASSITEGKVLSREQIRKLSDELIPAIKKYLSIKQLESQPALLEANLLQLMLDRKATSLFPKVLKDSKKRLSKKPIKDAEYYHSLHKLNLLEVSFEMFLGNSMDKDTYQAALDNYQKGVSYYIYKLLQAAQNSSNHRGYTFEFKLGEFVSRVYEQLLDEEFQEDPLLFVFREQYLGQQGIEIDLVLAWNTFKEFAPYLKKDDGINLYRVFTNLGLQARERVLDDRNQQLALFKLSYEMNTWAEEHLPWVQDFLDVKYIRNLMVNILRIAMLSDKEEKDKWIQKAILRINKVGQDLRLATEERKDFTEVYLAEIDFLEGNYCKVLESLENGKNDLIRLSSLTANLDAQRLFLQASFEEQEALLQKGKDIFFLERGLESYKRRIKYNEEKMRPPLYSQYIRGASYFTKLVMLEKREDLVELTETVAKERYFKLKYWILDKVEEKLGKV